MVRTWITDITPLLIEETYQKYYENVPLWRQEKAKRFRMAQDRARSIGAWTLWEYVKETEGLGETCVFNLSHSGNYALCSFSDEPGQMVGCDVEMIGDMKLSVARRFFCEEEYRHIVEIPDSEKQKEMFYRYWVLKESFMKATRKGMALDTRTYAFCWDEQGIPKLLKKPREYPEKYYCREYADAGNRARVAVCSTDADIDPGIHVLVL